jgi:FHS family L-fucose permease-like MFS transporter
MLIMFFESIMYPCIFVLGTSGLGRHTRRASALLVMGVSGGAVFPPIQGAIADKFSTRTSYYIIVPAFVYITGWAFWVWNKDGRKIRSESSSVVEHEVEASAGGAIPPAHVGLSYAGQEQYGEASEIKEDLNHVEKA